MAYGFGAQTSTATLTFLSTVSNGYFFKTSNVITNTTTISTIDFNSLYSLPSPIDPMGYTVVVDPNSSRNSWIATYSIGNIPALSSTYTAPSLQETTLTTATFPMPTTSNYIGWMPRLTARPAVVTSFGSTIKPTTGYGMFSVNDSGNVNIDETYESFYIHPTSTGQTLRTASVSSLPSTIPANGVTLATATQAGDYTFSNTQNVTFDQEFTNPPLIFVTSATVPVAVNQFIKNANGKYIGASIVCNSLLASSTPNSGVSYRQAQSGTFTYFIVSHETPVYGTSSTFGTRVFNGNGTKVFDSSYLVTNFYNSNIELPLTPYWSGTSTATMQWMESSTTFGTYSSNLGVCINSFSAWSGIMRYISAVASSDGVIWWSLGPVTFLGRYLSITPSGITGLNTFTLKGLGTNTIYPRYTSTFANQYNYFRSWDFNRNRTSVVTTSVVAAFYQY